MKKEEGRIEGRRKKERENNKTNDQKKSVYPVDIHNFLNQISVSVLSMLLSYVA